MTKYVWQTQNKANRNHYICEVHDTLNPKDSAILSQYFDGTQAAALAFFSSDPKIKSFMDNPRYSVTMRGNSIQLNWSDE